MSRRLVLRGPLDLGATLAPLVHGRGDRTIRLRRSEAWVAMRIHGGVATLHLACDGPTTLDLEAWGDAADAAIEGAADLVGESDEPERLHAEHPVVREPSTSTRRAPAADDAPSVARRSCRPSSSRR